MGWTAAGLAVGGIAWALGALVLALRAHAWRAAWSSPLVGMPPEARRRAMRQLRGRLPVDDAEIPTLRRIAECLTAQLWLPHVTGGLLLFEAANAMGSRTSGWVAFSVVTIAFVAVLTAVSYRNAIRVRRFLARNPADRPTRPAAGAGKPPS